MLFLQFSFLKTNFVLLTFAQIIEKNTFVKFCSSFFGPVVRKIQEKCEFGEPGQQQCLSGRVAADKGIRTVSAHSKRYKFARKTKYSTQSTHCQVCRRVVRSCLSVSSQISRTMQPACHLSIVVL